MLEKRLLVSGLHYIDCEQTAKQSLGCEMALIRAPWQATEGQPQRPHWIRLGPASTAVLGSTVDVENLLISVRFAIVHDTHNSLHMVNRNSWTLITSSSQYTSFLDQNHLCCLFFTAPWWDFGLIYRSATYWRNANISRLLILSTQVF